MNKVLVKAKRFLNRNSSTILTCVGAAGVVATSVLAVKATPKAMDILKSAEEEKGEKLTKAETIITAGPIYIPAVLVGASTIACIFGANVLNKRSQAALMSAYALLDNSYKEYKNKVIEAYGEEADLKIKKEIARGKYEESNIIESADDVLFFDLHSNRYFESSMDKVVQAEYNLNRKLSMFDFATLNDFYEYLGIPSVNYGDELGWSSGMNFECCWQSWVDFRHEKFELDDGMEGYIIHMQTDPYIGFEDY